MLFYSKSLKSKRLRNRFFARLAGKCGQVLRMFFTYFLSAKNCYTLRVFNVIKKGKTMADFNQILTPGDVDAALSMW